MTEVVELNTPWTSRAIGGGILALLFAAGAWFIQGSARQFFAPSAPVGSVAPDVQAVAIDGQIIDTQALRGQVLLLDFGTTRCVGCIGTTPKNNRLHRRLGPRGLVTLWINQDPGREEKVRDYVVHRPVEFPVIIDSGDINRAFAVQVFPTVVLVDAEGVIRARHEGGLTEDRLSREVETLLALRADPGPQKSPH